MSSDRLVLTALQRWTRAELRYFELVELRHGKDNHRCFLCIGDHAVFLVTRSMGGLFPNSDAGEIPYGHLARVVEDTACVNQLLLVLTEYRNEFWQSERLLVVAEHRSRLLPQLRAAWQTDHLWRRALSRELSCGQADLRASFPATAALAVQAHRGCKVVTHEGHTFFLKQGYEDIGESLHSGSTGTFVDRTRELTVTVQVQEPRLLSDLASTSGEHVRWVAMRQRQCITAELTGVNVVRSAFYHKKMNLVNDLAAWTAWEVFIKSDASVCVVICCRRSHLPPLLDTAQDIFISLKCPRRVLDSASGVTDGTLLAEARLAADSLAPEVHRATVPQTVYRDIIQAKLDALLFTPESMTWLKGSVGLAPDPHLQEMAKSFVKSVLKVLQEENALSSPDLVRDLGEATSTEKEPLIIPERLRRRGQTESAEGGESMANAWFQRVARYLAYCFDGGMLGSRLALVDLTDPFIATPRSQQKIDEVILFFLHVRPKDLSKKFELQQVKHMVLDPQLFEKNTFNDLVMQSLVELGWINKALLGGDAQGGTGSIGPEYADFLARLLVCDAASLNLRAAVCRQLTAADQAAERFGVLGPALMWSLRQPNVYLKTHAMLTLVSMVAEHEHVKDRLIKNGIVSIVVEDMNSSDDDLKRSALTLLTHLTKGLDRQHTMHQAGITDLAMKLLDKTPATHSKHELLAELASVIGQLCNREEAWKFMCAHPAHPLEKLMALFQDAPPCSRLRSKVMFALRLFCDRPKSHPNARRETIAQLLPRIVDDLQAMVDAPATLDLDNGANAILLLSTLIKSASCREAMISGPETLAVLAEVNMTELGSMDATRDRLHKLLRVLAKAKEVAKVRDSLHQPRRM